MRADEPTHGATRSLSGPTRSGTGFEVMGMRPRESWGGHENEASVEPLDLPAEVARWSGVRTAGTVVTEPAPAS